MKSKFIKGILTTLLLGTALVACKHEHTWDDGVVTIPATEISDGVKIYTCTSCDQTKIEIIPKTGTSTCNHSWDAGVITTQPTTTSEGIKEFTCSLCGGKTYEVVPKIDEETKFTVTYDANGGSGYEMVDLNQYSAGDKVTVKANTFTAPAGKEFINWNEEADGSGSYHNVNSSFKIYSNVTLYAQWLDEEIPDDGEHLIKVNAPSGVTCTLNKTKAEEGETITLTITLSSGMTLNGDPTSTQVSLTKTSENKYTFTMPNSQVTINVKATIDGDVILTGGIVAKLTDDDNDGIYSADVACNDKTSYDFTYVVKDSNNNPVRLSSLKLDETKCNAPITFSTGSEQLRITGGATYTFYYNSNLPDYNCYVQRKSVDVLPSGSNNTFLNSLFEGSMRSQTTVHPQGLTSITYEKTVNGNDTEQGYKVANEKYVYKKISDTESFAVSEDKTTSKNSYVYKNIDTSKNIYSIVNTYKKADGNNEPSDNVWTLDPYGYMQSDKERCLPYSAKQDIVSNDLYRDTSRYQITEREAYRNVSMAAHYSSELEYEIHDSLRGDFDGSAVINAATAEGSSINITSTRASTGFRVKVKSQLEYNHQATSGTTDSTMEFAFVYDVELTFLTNGDLYSLNYLENYYTKDSWNFESHTPKASATPIVRNIKASYKYNERFDRSEVLGDFNPDDYFISSIDKLSFYNEVTGNKDPNLSKVNFDDKIEIIPYLEGGVKASIVDEFVYSPATALDAWQYGYADSSDKSVIDETPYGPKAVGTGTCTVTFGNHLENVNGPTKDVNMFVYAGGTFRGLFVNCNEKGYDSYQGPHADYMYGIAGKTMTFYIDSSQNTGCPVSYHMVMVGKKGPRTVYSGTSEYFTVVNSVGTCDDDIWEAEGCPMVVGHALTLNFNTEASNALTEQKTIDIIFMSDYYEDPTRVTTLHVVVGPAQPSVINSKYTATYMYKEDNTKKYEDGTVEFMSNGVGKITEVIYSMDGNVLYTNIFNFTYVENNNNSIDAIITSVSIQEPDLPKTASSYHVAFERQLNGLLGVCLYVDDGGDIYGYTSEEDEGVRTVETLDGFERVND